jgi:hypothetical protein
MSSDDNSPPDPVARRRLLGVLSATWLAQAMYVLAKLGVPDLLREGPRPVTELAAACGADRDALARLLRALALAGHLTRPEPDTYGLTATTDLLRGDAPGSLRLAALMQGEEVFRSFAEIMHTMRTGQPAFEKVYGQPFYDYLGSNPEAAYTFNESMGGQAPPAALAACDIGDDDVLVDVGGGNGSLLSELLRHHPARRGVLLDLPEAVDIARDHLARTGVAHRVECVAGSFFAGVPAGGDVYLLCRVLHNWTDPHVADILRRVHAAMRPGARLLVLEDVVPESGRSGAALGDLLMLVTLEGRDRTAAEYRDLLVQAGFQPVRDAPGLIEARRT